MKNTTNQESSYTLLPALRVAFKSEEGIEERVNEPARTRKKEKIKVEPSKVNLPLFNDYRIKARDYDPL